MFSIHRKLVRDAGTPTHHSYTTSPFNFPLYNKKYFFIVILRRMFVGFMKGQDLIVLFSVAKQARV